MMNKLRITDCNSKSSKKLSWALFLVLFSWFSFAQEIATSIDTTSIKIGEELKLQYLIQVESTDLVIFPEAKNMGLLEVINSYKIDTLNKGKNFTLKKEYGLTQFDSGHYTLPVQKIIINGKPYLTDSLLIEVKDVVVDTTKQKLFDIKPIFNVEKPSSGFPMWILYILSFLVVLAGLLYFIFFKKTKAEKELENKLPPFENAISQLVALKDGDLLENEEYKKYYTQLTDVLKHYLDEEVYEDALENTTDEVLEKLELLRDSGKLPISKEMITNLRAVLRTSDLVKFAKSKPDLGTAKVDRNTIEFIINETKEAIPEPTEEELLLDEQYKLVQLKKIQRKKMIYASIIGLSIIILAGVGLGFKYGFNNLKDQVFGHDSKTLLEGNWVRSEYGNPVVIITTPEVLKRVANEQTKALNIQSFSYGNLGTNLAVVLNTTQIPQIAQMGALNNSEDEDDEKPRIDLELVNEQTLQLLEQQGATNVVLKQDGYEFSGGLDGMKAYGTLNFEEPITKQKQEISYQILSFTQDDAIQQVLVFHQEGDKYAKEIVARIIASVELKKEEE